VCEYVVDGVESKRVGCSMILSLPSYILGMASFLIFAWTFMCPYLLFLFHGLSCALFQYIAHALTGKNFWERLYGIWNIKDYMNEWMVWKCYSSSVEVFACGGGVYVILDHESMKRNSQRSQNLTKLKKIQAACR